jgi:hypothetical protein
MRDILHSTLFLASLLAAIPAFGQSAGSVAPVPVPIYTTAAGAPCSGCLLYTYTVGTTSNLTVYTNSALTIAHTNPIVIDSAGHTPSPIYLATATIAKFVLKTSAGATLWTADGVAPAGLLGSITVGTSLAIAGIENVTSLITPPQIVANQNDYTPTGIQTARFILLSTDASRNITGIAAPTTGGRLLTIINGGAFDIVIKVLSVSSIAANRIQCPGNVDLTLNLGDAVTIWYDSSFALWRVIGY